MYHNALIRPTLTELQWPPHTCIHAFRGLGKPHRAVIDAISGPLSWSDVCVCRPSPSLPCDFDRSKQLTGPKELTNTSTSLSLSLQSSLSSLTLILIMFSFFRFFFLAWHFSNSRLPSSTLSVLQSYISDSVGTTSTCSSADVCINQTAEGPVGLDKLKARDSPSHLPVNLLTPACSATLERAMTPCERSLAASSISMRA